MDEKERQDINLRAERYVIGGPKFGEITTQQRFLINIYIQGALDQDTISREKRTEEIIDRLQDLAEGHPDAHVIHWVIKGL